MADDQKVADHPTLKQALAAQKEWHHSAVFDATGHLLASHSAHPSQAELTYEYDGNLPLMNMFPLSSFLQFA
jgi:hypothetical protein